MANKTITITPYVYALNEVDEIHPLHIKGALNECYGRYSIYKENAYRFCVDRVRDLQAFFKCDNCYEYGVNSYNTCFFTFGANFYREDELIATYYETSTRREITLKKGVMF